MTSEVTGAKVRRIAGKVLRANWSPGTTAFLWHQSTRTSYAFDWSDIRALAASALTQSPPKPVPPRAHADIEWGDTEPVRKPKRKSKRKPKFVARKVSLRGKRA